MTSFRIFLVAASGIILAAGSVVVWAATHRKSPDERERERRAWLNAIGRLTDGTVVDVNEAEDLRLGHRRWVIYSYDVAGVQYECSQDVTLLSDGERFSGLGLPASIKYDPHNPGNSIVTSESWSGLRK